MLLLLVVAVVCVVFGMRVVVSCVFCCVLFVVCSLCWLLC